MAFGAYGYRSPAPERKSFDPDPQRNADRGESLQDILSTVWQCEREWAFDLEITYRTRAR